jgi:hypothetical protein
LKVSLGLGISSLLVIAWNALFLRGLAVGQAYFVELLKYIFKLLAFFIGNVSAMI